MLLKEEFRKLLLLAAKESYLIFNGKLYRKVDGFYVDSSLGQTLANTFSSLLSE